MTLLRNQRSVDLRDFIWVPGALGWVLIAAGMIVMLGPFLGLAAGLMPIILVLIVQKSWFRMLLVVVGGLFVFGSSSDVGPAKVLYFAVLLLCAAVSFVRLVKDPPAYLRHFRFLPALGLCFITFMVLSTFAGSADYITAIRQSVFYFMVPIAPIIGLDVGRDLKPKVVMRWIGVIGTAAAIGFATDWLERRGVSSLSVGKIMLSSLILPALAFSLAFVHVALAKGSARFSWAISVVVIPVAMLITGTRTNLVIFLAVLAVIGSAQKFRVPLIRAVVIVGSCVAAAAMLIPILGKYVLNSPEFLESRVEAMNGVLTGTGADQSLASRSEQYDYAASMIAESPWLGWGAGFVAPMSMDTPLVTIVKLGAIGTMFLVGFLIMTFVGIMRSGRAIGGSPMHTASLGLGVIILANIPFGTPIEDRGFGFTLLLIFTGIASTITSPPRDGFGTVSPVSPIAIERRRTSAGFRSGRRS
ncbi:hypothetical protein ASH00_11755 [Arthrobacter sp. Soil782]|uniref:O-antigen ligase family protein n=1 Tax=Arthrobacter sp. Soil782 TaxID=1736410 RepID=UPI0007012453|nr:O-antigen ligase family protein [Arthrobacter sp. Soil782]KRF05103.1 hypothetical protein ASH00_11755 [Arthrobacter sp. Soil782]